LLHVNKFSCNNPRMIENNGQNGNGGAGDWLRRRDKWMRELISSAHVSRNGKLAGVYLALRMSAKRPFTYPAINSMALDLGISPRQVSRAMSELVEESFITRTAEPGRANIYRLAM
jgi:hypothetical protein